VGKWRRQSSPWVSARGGADASGLGERRRRGSDGVFIGDPGDLEVRAQGRDEAHTRDAA
jgi:hypothetical protein